METKPKMKILLVEDDQEIGNWIKKGIDALGNIQSFDWAGDCAQATDLLNLALPDIVILDLKLPDGNGIDILKHIRKTKSDTKVYVFSVNSELERTCIRLGANQFFDKSTDGEKLLLALS